MQQINNAVRYIRLASLGKHKFQIKLGDYYLEECEGASCLEKSEFWYQEALAAGYVPALHKMGEMYFLGIGKKRNTKEALKYFKQAAERGYGASYYNLAKCYLYGIGSPTDNRLAMECLLQGAQRGFALAQFALGELYSRGQWGESFPQKIISSFIQALPSDERDEYLRSRMPIGREELEYSRFLERCREDAEYLEYHSYAKAGKSKKVSESWRAKQRSAMSYWMRAEYEPQNVLLDLRELGISPDPQQAFAWYQKAALHGLACAQFRLAECYFDGIGTAQDYRQGMYWFAKTRNAGKVLQVLQSHADKGKADAQFALGEFYHHGQLGSRRKSAQALKWYQKAAEQGHAMAQYRLGKMLQATHYRNRGKKMPVWSRTALEWLLESAHAGIAQANYLTGKYYFELCSDDQLQHRCFEFFERAALQNYAPACHLLGDCYFIGIGIEKNLPQALMWYAKAVSQDYVAARDTLDECEECGLEVENADSDYWRKSSRFRRTRRRRSKLKSPKSLQWYEQFEHDANEYVREIFSELLLEHAALPQNSQRAGSYRQRSYRLGDVNAAYLVAEDFYSGSGGLSHDYTQAVEWYRLAAESGHSEACYALAECCAASLGGADPSQAKQWYEKAASSGHLGAMRECGRLDIERLKSMRSLEWYSIPAAEGNAYCCYKLGLYFYDEPTKNSFAANRQKAVELFALAASQGLSAAKCALGNCYCLGFGVERDLIRGFALYREAAEQGDAVGQFCLAEAYNCDLLSQGKQSACYWYEKAANQGYVPARSVLGLSSLKDPVLPPLPEEWYLDAARKDNAHACFNVALMHKFDHREIEQLGGLSAYRLLQSAAKQKHTLALYVLGCMNIRYPDDNLLQAAADGHSMAQLRLAHVYSQTRRNEEQHKTALAYYHKAAAAGNFMAWYRLAECYEFGRLVDRDFDQAEKYWRLSLLAYENAPEFKHATKDYRIPLKMGFYRLAMKYKKGKLVEQDTKRSEELFKISANMGFYEAKTQGKGIKDERSWDCW